jgi:hypothetical protein
VRVEPAVGPHVVEARSLEQLDCPPGDRMAVERALGWARSFLTAPNPAIGRNGPVCPYLQESSDRGHLFVSYRLDADCSDDTFRAGLLDYATTFATVRDQVPAEERHLVAMVIVLPHVDVTSATPLDELQAGLKSRFVEQGLMIGQFHPLCEAPGLWRDDFRPLQSPVPFLAIREMVASDLPFLMGHPDHATTYFSLFAPGIPTHIRRHLVEALVTPPPAAGASPTSGPSPA